MPDDTTTSPAPTKGTPRSETTGPTYTKIAAVMAVKGWEFLPTGPNEMDWIRFDEDGVAQDRGGTVAFINDYDAAIEFLKKG